MTINGNGATLTGPGVARGLVASQGGGLTINDLTITGFGAATGGGDNAPVVASGGVTLNSCSITGNNITTDEGDIAGGVLAEGGNVSITDCTITGNSATSTGGDVGGAVLSESGTIVVVTSTTSGNTASTSQGDAGGGLISEGGPVTVRARPSTATPRPPPAPVATPRAPSSRKPSELRSTDRQLSGTPQRPWAPRTTRCSATPSPAPATPSATPAPARRPRQPRQLPRHRKQPRPRRPLRPRPHSPAEPYSADPFTSVLTRQSQRRADPTRGRADCPIRPACRDARSISSLLSRARSSCTSAAVSWRAGSWRRSVGGGPGVVLPKCRLLGCEVGHAGRVSRPRLPSRTASRRVDV